MTGRRPSACIRNAVLIIIFGGFIISNQFSIDFTGLYTQSAGDATPVVNDTKASTPLLLSSLGNNALASPLDCSQVPRDEDPHIIVYRDAKHGNLSTAVDLPWWNRNLNPAPRPPFNQPMVDLLLEETLQEELFVDVGANVGQTALWGLVTGRPTLAFDPLQLDMIKICEGIKSSIEKGFAYSTMAKGNFALFRNLVGNENKAQVNISRPEDAFGRFEQASLASNTIGVARKPKLVTETIPMVTLDSVIPQGMAVGLVKIDVQGAEMMVIEGMKEIFSRKRGYPVAVYYEEQERVTRGAGYRMGAVQKVLEGYGYTCGAPANDITCRKSRHEEATA